MESTGVAHEMLAFGRELEAEGAAQVGDSFTGDPGRDALLRSSPEAFLLGILFTQGMPAERAWSGPALLLERLGTIDPCYLAAHPDEVREAVQARPMLHRFKETLPRWIVAAARRVLTEYEADASLIWPDGSHVLDVTQRLMAFDGIGRKKALMAVEILSRHFGARFVGRECGQVAYDVHVRRVFLRTGLADEDSVIAVESAAARACPDSPGTLDLPAWLIGRQWCRPRAPRCEACRLGIVCPRLTHRDAKGVGAPRDSGRGLLGRAEQQAGE
jgi:uncharacterized HhH-GPD family protein